MRVIDSSSDINVLETSHRTRVPKLGADGVREVTRGDKVDCKYGHFRVTARVLTNSID